MMRRQALPALCALLLLAACRGELEDGGTIRAGRVDSENVWARERNQTSALRDLGAPIPKQILFGKIFGLAPITRAHDDLATKALDLVSSCGPEIRVQGVARFELLTVDQHCIGAVQWGAILVEVAEQS